MADKLNYSTYQTHSLSKPQVGNIRLEGYFLTFHIKYMKEKTEGSEKEKILINLVMKHSFEH